MDDLTRLHRQKTLLAQALGAYDTSTNGIVPAIHMATTFLRDADNAYSEGYVYGRADSASVRQAQQIVAALDRAEDALLFASGMAAATAVFLAVDPSAHIVVSQEMYWGLRGWLQSGVLGEREITFVDTADLSAVQDALKPGRTRLVWVETPSNPLWTITDIAAVADLAHAAGADLCVDSTIATPIFSCPLSLGADMVMHSATKYLNGHSDVVAGTLSTLKRTDLWQRVARRRDLLGLAPGSFEAWLLIRGLRTLDLRVRAQAAAAALLADRLSQHAAVMRVLYPGLPHHEGHDIARRQMTEGFGAMLSIRLASAETAIAVAANVRLWRRATSFGGVESLVEHRASIEGPGSPCPADLLRLSVGLEDVDDLYADLCMALALAN
jgi:cystathionine gamma-synthase